MTTVNELCKIHKNQSAIHFSNWVNFIVLNLYNCGRLAVLAGLC